MHFDAPCDAHYVSCLAKAFRRRIANGFRGMMTRTRERYNVRRCIAFSHPIENFSSSSPTLSLYYPPIFAFVHRLLRIKCKLTGIPEFHVTNILREDRTETKSFTISNEQIVTKAKKAFIKTDISDVLLFFSNLLLAYLLDLFYFLFCLVFYIMILSFIFILRV